MESARSTSPSKIFDNILNIDLAHGLFNRFMDTINRHDSQLKSMLSAMEERVHVKNFSKAIDAIEERMLKFDRRLDCIERSITSCQLSIEKVHQKLEAKANKVDLCNTEGLLKNNIKESVKQMKLRTMDKTTGDQLLNLYNCLQHSIAAQQSVIATKLDQSETAHIKSMLSKVGAVSEFLDETKQHIDELAVISRESQQNIRKLESDVCHVNEHIKQLAEKQALKADSGTVMKMGKKLDYASEKLTIASQWIDQCTKVQEYNRKDLQSKLDVLAKAVNRRFNNIERITNQSLYENITTKLKNEVLALTSEFRNDLTSKAPKDAVNQLAQKLDSLNNQHSVTAKNASFAIRFIDWFSAREEANKHNLESLERKIQSLSMREC